MKIYLDEDLGQPLLAKLLRHAGHDVQMPADVGLVGKSDPVQLAHAARQGRVLLTGNHEDFEDLHDLVLIVGGHHPGILVVRRDNDPARDMTVRGVVHAIGKVEASTPDLTDIFQALNHWR